MIQDPQAQQMIMAGQQMPPQMENQIAIMAAQAADKVNQFDEEKQKIMAGENKTTAEEQLDILELDLGQLMQTEVIVTSVSKRPQKLHEAASAIFVVTQEDIRRTGAVNIMEALRIVPGLLVSKIDQNQYAVSARGFNSQFGSNKLLVLMDGRTIYNPSFAGVIWAAQDTMMEDIDRIEVIRGPGAALWGSNAVAGVINIITRTDVN